ncbi:hypothetical protein [Brevibacillus daliensis]|nr:hypothetical protein [Brevibacillus daliensis]
MKQVNSIKKICSKPVRTETEGTNPVRILLMLVTNAFARGAKVFLRT